MKEYKVELSAKADMSAVVFVKAQDDVKAVKEAVRIAKSGNVDWEYDGVESSTIEYVTCDDGEE